MKKPTLALTAFTVSALCLAFTFGAQADTTSAPAAPRATIAPEAPTAPGVDSRADIRPNDPAVPIDPDQIENQAKLRAALEKCNGIVSNDSKTRCMDEAKRSFSD